jgi:hypothetical protein
MMRRRILALVVVEVLLLVLVAATCAGPTETPAPAPVPEPTPSSAPTLSSQMPEKLEISESLPMTVPFPTLQSGHLRNPDQGVLETSESHNRKYEAQHRKMVDWPSASCK